jgi:glycosyltransferase involved in cell wall biosynthesis
MVVERSMRVVADIYHFHDPELLPHASAFSRTQKKVIYDVHEDLPRQISTKPWIPSWLRPTAARIAERMELRNIAYVAGIVAATPLIENRFRTVHRQTCCIFNAPLLSEFEREFHPNYSSRRMVYIGVISEKRGIIEILKALEQIDGRLNLAGKFESDLLMERCKSMPAWSKVDYHGTIDREAIAQLLEHSCVGLVTLHPTSNYLDSYPIKMFEYMGASLPVLASDFPLWQSIVHKQNAGICVDPLNASAIADAVNSLFDNPAQCHLLGLNGRSFVLNEFNWEAEAIKLNTFYQHLMH